MTRLRQLSLLTIIGSASFVFAFVAKRTRQAPAASTTRAALPAGAPDSVRLAAMGIKQGPQLVAYVFGGSRCGYCKRPETKAAYASLRRLLRQNIEGTFRSVSVVGVAINTDLREGLQYLQSIGDSSFDEISVGKGWLNEHVERLCPRRAAHEQMS